MPLANFPREPYRQMSQQQRQLCRLRSRRCEPHGVTKRPKIDRSEVGDRMCEDRWRGASLQIKTYDEVVIWSASMRIKFIASSTRLLHANERQETFADR
ncbi:unnamed protein product [Soboliphyme baturini]|uniref:Transposase n=1 Tax=Soboliphyme baturini TaxID=241478 RepID=A0A183J1I5_9BILA|nr:unnamed protein product [Soboliphyme baturini]